MRHDIQNVRAETAVTPETSTTPAAPHHPPPTVHTKMGCGQRARKEGE